MALRIVLDEHKCSGLGLCEAVAPDLFEVLDDGSLQVLDPNPGDELRSLCEQAIAACPTEALRLIVE